MIPNLLGSAGLVPVVRLAQDAGLPALADSHLSVPTDKGANAGRTVCSLVAGMGRFSPWHRPRAPPWRSGGSRLATRALPTPSVAAVNPSYSGSSTNARRGWFLL